MFAYCGNNPVCYLDSSGSAARTCLDQATNPNKAPWREDSPGGGGYTYQYHPQTSSSYGSVEDKFLSVLFLKGVVNVATNINDVYMQGYNMQHEAQLVEAQLMSTVSPRVIKAGAEKAVFAVIEVVAAKEFEKVINDDAPNVTLASLGVAFAAGFVVGTIEEIWEIIKEVTPSVKP